MAKKIYDPYLKFGLNNNPDSFFEKSNLPQKTVPYIDVEGKLTESGLMITKYVDAAFLRTKSSSNNNGGGLYLGTDYVLLSDQSGNEYIRLSEEGILSLAAGGNVVFQASSDLTRIGSYGLYNHTLAFEEGVENAVRLNSRASLTMLAENDITIGSNDCGQVRLISDGSVSMDAESISVLSNSGNIYFEAPYIEMYSAGNGFELSSGTYINIAANDGQLSMSGYSYDLDAFQGSGYCGASITLGYPGGQNLVEFNIHSRSNQKSIFEYLGGGSDLIRFNSYISFDSTKVINGANFNSMAVTGGMFLGYGTIERVMVSNSLGAVKSITKAEFNAWLNS